MKRSISEFVQQAYVRPAACICLLLALALLSWPAAAQDKPRLNGVALVIGQSDYEHIAALPNPANDAREIAKLLTDLGFDARSVSDRDAKKLSRDLERFVEDAEGADVAFLYYSGHGIESAGENWLVPVDADIGSLENARERLVSVSAVIDQLKETVPISIVLLDACRTNPFPAGAQLRQTPTGSAEPLGTQGLTLVRGARALTQASEGAESLGTVIGFAAEPGRPALDGPAGGNSPYASALVRHLSALQGAEFGAVMRMVTEEVYLDTGTRQRPWINESLRRFLYFGAAPDEPEGDEALITGERRRLLLTISALPEVNRSQVERAALKDDVPLDALYGVLKALGTDSIPEDPSELGKVLDAQAERLKALIGQRDALRSDDPEIARLTASADRAIRQGAIESARKFLDGAVARVEATSDAVDEAEELIRQKRLADAAVYARRAETVALDFDYIAAAADYGKAASLVERWDGKLFRTYLTAQAAAFRDDGMMKGRVESLERSLEIFRTVLGSGDLDIQRQNRGYVLNNVGVALQAIGEKETGTDRLLAALDTYREALGLIDPAADPVEWANTQNNLGTLLRVLGERQGDAARLGEAIEAFGRALERQDRAKVPLDWASTQNNIGVTLHSLAERDVENDRLLQAATAYRLALGEYSREKTPVEWAMVQNNLGNTLNTLGANANDPALIAEAAAAYRLALEVRTRENLPVSWGVTRLNLASALSNATKFEISTAALEEAAAALRDALTVFTRKDFPLDWASAQNNLGANLQTLGQRKGDTAIQEESASASRAALRVYDRKAFPRDWAMTKYNLGNTLQLMGGLSGEPQRYREAISNYNAALLEYDRAASPRQWALAQAGLGAALQWLSNSEEDTASLVKSVAARRAALEVLTMETAPVDWANAQNGIGMSLINLGTRERTGKYLAEAEAALTQSLKVFTREGQPLQWAFGQNNLGDVCWNRASLGGGRPDYEKAKRHFELAKQGFAESGYLAPIAITDKKIELIDQVLAQK